MVTFAALILIILFFVPFWEILMWAPQYPEWLSMKIWLNTLTGDVEIINGLNHYIGMKHIKVEMFPEFKIMPYIVTVLILLGISAGIWGRKIAIISYLIILIIIGVVGLYDFYMWGYDYGHNLDPSAAIKVPGMSYQPPLIGTKELLNFIAYSGPDIGGWIAVMAGILVITSLLVEKYKIAIARKFPAISGFL